MKFHGFRKYWYYSVLYSEYISHLYTSNQKTFQHILGCLEIFAYLCNTSTPKPLNNAQIGGRFIFIPNDNQFPETIQQPGGFGRVAVPKGACFRQQESCLPIHPQHRSL